MRAYEIAVGTYFQRGVLWPTNSEDFPEGVPLWRSVFQYDQHELGPWLDQHRTLTGKYSGQVYCDDHIVLDFDGPQAGHEVIRLCHALSNEGAMCGVNYQVWMSGSKGYHVWLPTSMFNSMNADQVRETLKQNFGHFKTLDVSMYHRSGLIRMPLSIHQKSGRQVLPIMVEDLVHADRKGWPYGQLYEWVENDTGDEDYTLKPTWDKDPIFKAAKHKMRRTNATKAGQLRTNRIICMQDMVSKPPPEGQRHDYALRAASWLRRLGLPQQVVLDSLLSWVGDGDTRDTQRAVESVFEGGLEYGCHDPVLDAHCDSKCIFYSQKAGMKPTIRPFSDQFAALKSFRQKIEEGRGINLRNVLPFRGILHSDYWILPGECAVFTGDTGMGKSAIVQNIIVSAQKRTLYLNLENAEELMTRRFIQIAMGGVDKSYVENGIRMNVLPKQDLKKLECISQVATAPDIDSLEAMVKDHEPEVLVVDTTDVIEVPQAGNNEMWQLKRVVERLRKIAANYDVIVVGIHHINKASSKEGKMDLNSLSGNRANVTRMDHVFALKGVRRMKKRMFFTLKSRDSDPFSLDLDFHGNRMFFTEHVKPKFVNQNDDDDAEEAF